MKLFIILMILQNIWANDDRARMLLKSNNIQTLKAESKQFEQEKKLNISCEFELEKNLVPKSCYSLKLSKSKLQIIDEACERAVLEMKKQVKEDHLSPRCKSFVQKKNKDLQYSESELKPEEVIRR